MKQAREEIPSVDTPPSKDQGSGDIPVKIEEEKIFQILSKNPGGFCFGQSKDDKITAGIEEKSTFNG